MNYTFLIVVFTVISFVVHSQETNSDSSDKDDLGPLNTVTIGAGRSYDINQSSSHSNVGFDYLRRFHRKWEAGIQLDFDWEKKFIEFEGVQVAGIVVYNITSKWPVFGGLGVANEANHTDAFVRFGTEYTFFFGKSKRFFIAPGTFTDIYLDEVAVSAIIALGCTF